MNRCYSFSMIIIYTSISPEYANDDIVIFIVYTPFNIDGNSHVLVPAGNQVVYTNLFSSSITDNT